jgi:signal transduction histidine kinase/CheY-like chemotaxis protein
MTVEVDPASSIHASPVVLFGLFLHYAFLRLPLKSSALIGWVVAGAAMQWSPAVVGGNETLRNFVYLAFANLAGMAICRSHEQRERALFAQRNELEVARTEARERAAAAEEANREKTRLIAAVSHDLRQPMMAAVAHLDVLRHRLDAGELRAAVEQSRRAESSVAVLGATLDHLLTAARYDSGTEAIRLDWVDADLLLRQLHDSFAAAASGRGVTLRLRASRRRVLVRTDVRSLHRVLTNLISNAVKFTDGRTARRPCVLVTLRLRGDTCRIAVRDNGLGIAPEHHASIWMPYVQVNNAERDRERGLGLGLFLVRRIVEQLPGHAIAMRSAPGRGSCFEVTLPSLVTGDVAPPADEPVDEPALGAVERADLVGAYVLLIEDDREARESLRDMLQAWGVLVSAGATLGEALGPDANSDRLLDAVICDYRLPGGENGLDCIERLGRHLGYSPGAVVITGESDVGRIRAAAPAGVTVLHKPFSPRSLATPLLAAVRRARAIEAGIDGEPTHDRAHAVRA